MGHLIGSADPRRPPATVVVATHARSGFLPDCVSSIAEAMSSDDELIVVECCNPDASAVLARLDVRVRHLSDAHAGKSTKINRAIGLARSEVILITDDDCRVPDRWVDAMSSPFENPVVGAAFGPSVGLSSTPGGSPAPVIGPGPAPPELWNFAHGLSMAVRRRAAVDIGGFDERLGAGTPARGGEEADVVLRLEARGWTCFIAEAPPVRHLDWRDEDETTRNLLGYQRGAGTYLGAGIRRDPRHVLKPLLLRLRHEEGYWKDRRTRPQWFGPRMSTAFLRGLTRGLTLRPRRFLESLDAPPNPVRTSTRVLWVTDEPPDRHKGGGNIRQAMLLDALTERVDVTLLLAGQLEDDITRQCLTEVLEVPRPRVRSHERPMTRRLRDLCRVLWQRLPSDVTSSARIHRILAPVLERIGDDFDVVVLQHLTMAPLLPRRHRAIWLLELHNLASARARQEFEVERGRRQRWLLRLEAANASHFEKRVVRAFDGLIVVSDGDAETLCASGAHVVPNGVDTSSAPFPIGSEPTILLPATFDYRPNVLGARWFCAEVLPLVRVSVPDVRFALVGRYPVPEVIALAQNEGVELHADVPRMEPWLAWARVVVVPLHVGSGTRLKALQAMAAGRPLVGTTIGLEGLGLVDGVHARITDDPRAMALAIVELLASDSAAQALAASGRRVAERDFRWAAIGARLADVVASAARGEPRT